MFENYKATKEDLDAVLEGISYVWKSELDFIFEDKSRIEKTVVISYDSEFIYLFSHEKPVEKIPHSIKIPDEEQKGWCASVYFGDLEKCLPEYIVKSSRNELPRISGALFIPMIETQKKLKKENNAYTTRESYLATIVHEFGHVYFNSFKKWYFSDLAENLQYMNTAIKLFDGLNVSSSELHIKVPVDYSFTEIFAFCTDYSAASIFWPHHATDLNKMHAAIIRNMMKKEKELNLEKQDSYLGNKNKSAHLLASIVGIVLINKYPKDWPQKLLEPYNI